MFRLLSIGLLSLVVFTACDSLSASLLGGGNEFSFTETYTRAGGEHSITMSFVMEGNEIVGLRIEPGAESALEQSIQIAFSANIRSFVLAKNVNDIDLSKYTGRNENHLVKIFKETLEKLRAEL